MTFLLDRDRLVRSMKEQAEFGETDDGGLDRLTLSDEDRAVRDWLAEQMRAAGLEARVDEFGNMFGRRAGTDPDAGTILVGSHLDSQPYGGIYDGALGVTAALEFVRSLEDEGIETAHPIELVNWTNEEGSRFQPATQGSGVWAGVHDIETEYDKTDAGGARLEEELERIGYKGDVPAAPQYNYDAALELHIEQGPYLEENDMDVGVVTGIVGISWGAVTFRGEANHSGTTPMHHRSDALVAGADLITAIRRIATTVGDRTVGTAGYADIDPNSINIIPEEVMVTWGFRDSSADTIARARERVLEEAAAAADREELDWEYKDRMSVDPVQFPNRCTDAVQQSADTHGFDSMQVFSGGVHDIQHLDGLMDTGMVFAVSEGGKSHTEDEYTSWADCYSAANTLASAALELATED
jgi:N-carbamoyl-L-amino-acid hydrolase